MGDLQIISSPEGWGNKKRTLKNVHGLSERKGLSANRYKELLGIWAVGADKQVRLAESMMGMKDKFSQGNRTGSESYGPNKENNRVSRRRRANNAPKRRRLYIQQRESSCSEMEKSDAAREKEQCVICKHGGNLLSCTGRACLRSFHLGCLNPPLSYSPPGAWYCIWCVREKVESGVHAVSPGLEAILDVRDVPAGDEEIAGEKQYLVKYRGLAHVHSWWISERELTLQVPGLLRKYKRRNQTVNWKTDWSIPHRLLQKRLLTFPEDSYLVGGPDGCRYEWLVKWRGLSYEYATWELEDASFLRSPEAKKLIKYFEQRHKREISELYTSDVDEGERAHHPQFSNFDFKGFKALDEIGNNHTTYLNILHQTWLRRQNSVIIDEQERITRVTLFILSLPKDVNQPSLVITTSRCLSMWEAEFSRWMPSANVVVYRGNGGVRAMIRTLEFYNESGCIMFQVLLSTLDAIIEDQVYVESLNWAVIVVDESELLMVPVRLNHIKVLQANMRFLLISDHIKDTRSNYKNILSFLDHEHDESHEDSLDARENNCTLILKEKMNQFVAYRCPFTTRRFLEYWVPVQLSDVQREQYCASLLSNSLSLCSSSKDDSFESLHDVMLSSRKCCDHPYLVNYSLRSSVIQGIQDAPTLDAEIEVSGKLRLLDKILGKIKERELQVLILFQRIGASTRVSIGDIIDDFIHQRYGDSYTRIDGDYPFFKQREAADVFNNDEGKFICLMETRACVPTIKLQSVDTIILFDSNWEPLNDLKSLQKITISSQFDQLAVLRLYSSCTLEESLLVSAKEGVNIGCSLSNIKQSTCQRLLSWGASYQFHMLNSTDGPQAHSSNVSCGQALLEQVLSELEVLLPTNFENSSSADRKLISEVQFSEGAYSCDISLLGELENRLDSFSTWKHFESEPPHIFWKNLLQERRLHRSSQIRRKFQYQGYLTEEFEPGSQEINGCRKETNGIIDLTDLKNKLMAKRKCSMEGKQKKFTTQLLNGKRSRRNNFKIKENGKALSVKNNMRVRKRNKGVFNGRRVPTLFSSCATQDLDSPSEIDVSSMHEEQVPSQFIYSTQQTISHLDGNSRISESLDGTNVRLDMEDNPRVESSRVMSEMPQPEIPVGKSVLHTDRSNPWHTELEKIQRVLELTTKLHEEKKLQLQCEREKEIDEIHKHYATVLQSVETDFMHKKEDLLTSYNQVSTNKSLAEVMMQMQSSAQDAGFKGTQKVTVSAFMEEIFELFVAPTNTTSTPFTKERTLLEPDKAVARITRTDDVSVTTTCTDLVPVVASSVDAVANSWTVSRPASSCGYRGQLSIPSIHVGGNLQTGCIVRATAPHLRNNSHRCSHNQASVEILSTLPEPEEARLRPCSK